VLAALTVVGFGGPVLADAPPAGRNLFLEEGKRQIARGRPEAAVDELRRALDLPGLPETQRLETLAWLGAALQLSRDEVEAERIWASRFREAPDVAMPEDLPEEVREAYESARQRTVVIQHLPPPGAFAGLPLNLHASLVDRLGRTSDLLAYTRRQGEAGYQVTGFSRRAEGWTAEVIPPPLAGAATEYALEYYLVAQAGTGEVLHSLGDAGRPLAVQTRPPPGGVAAADGRDVRVQPAAPAAAVAVDTGAGTDAPPRQSAAWVWVAIIGAGVLAGGVVAVAAATGAEEEILPATSLGTIRYPLERDGR
jgi:hypothetical protein